MNILTEPPQKSDFGAWQALYCAYARFYGMPMAQSTIETVWSWIFDTGTSFHCLVAKDIDLVGDDKKNLGNVVGLMHYRGMPSPLRGTQVGFLDDLFVDESYRGKGVTDALFEQLKMAADSHGWPFVRWITADDNVRARKCYDRLASQTPWVTYQLDLDPSS